MYINFLICIFVNCTLLLISQNWLLKLRSKYRYWSSLPCSSLQLLPLESFVPKLGRAFIWQEKLRKTASLMLVISNNSSTRLQWGHIGTWLRPNLNKSFLVTLSLVGFMKCFGCCGGDQVVSILASNSDDPSSNPADVHNFWFEIVVENKQKWGRDWPIFKKQFMKYYIMLKGIVYLSLSRWSFV